LRALSTASALSDFIIILHVNALEPNVQQVPLGTQVSHQIILRPLADTQNLFASGLSCGSQGAFWRSTAEHAWEVHPKDLFTAIAPDSLDFQIHPEGWPGDKGWHDSYLSTAPYPPYASASLLALFALGDGSVGRPDRRALTLAPSHHGVRDVFELPLGNL
jgi:hypothetical protein